VNWKLEPWLIDLIERVQGAIDQVENDEVESGIGELAKCREAVPILDSNDDLDHTFLLQHAANWVMLQQASILSDVERFDEAESIYESVRSWCVGNLSISNQDGSWCFCQEFASSTMGLAQLRAAQGKFAESIAVFRDATFRNHVFHHVPEQYLSQSVGPLVDMWGNYLGYDNLYSRLNFRFSEQDLSGNFLVDESHWKFPIPLKGRGHYRREIQLQDEVDRFRKVDVSNLHSTYPIMENLCAMAVDWAEQMRFSSVAREFALRFSIYRTELEMKLDLSASFVDSMENLQLLISEALENFPEHVDMQLSLVTSLIDLSNAILYHEVGTDDDMRRNYAYGYGCVATSQSIIDEIRSTHEVSQAVALADCRVLNMAAICNDMIGNSEVASWDRRRLVCIVEEIVRRDPTNDEAIRLHDNYKDLEITVDQEMALDVSNWRWRVVPLLEAVE
jgi:hypothetical protein